MIEVFKKYLNLSDADWDIIAPVCTMKKLRRQQYLLQEGDVWRYHAFVCKGCLRRYRIDEKGTEHIIQFSIENWWAGDRESLLNNTPAKYNIDAVEDSEIVLIRTDDFNMLCQKVPAFNDFINNILNRSFIASQQRIDAAISLNAEEKYLHFIQTFPNLANRVPRHMLASYLGITPETLSRIRNNVARK